MKRTIRLLAILLVFGMISTAGCISKTELEAVQEQLASTQDELETAQEQLASMNPAMRGLLGLE